MFKRLCSVYHDLVLLFKNAKTACTKQLSVENVSKNTVHTVPRFSECFTEDSFFPQKIIERIISTINISRYSGRAVRGEGLRPIVFWAGLNLAGGMEVCFL